MAHAAQHTPFRAAPIVGDFGAIQVAGRFLISSCNKTRRLIDGRLLSRRRRRPFGYSRTGGARGSPAVVAFRRLRV